MQKGMNKWDFYFLGAAAPWHLGYLVGKRGPAVYVLTTEQFYWSAYNAYLRSDTQRIATDIKSAFRSPEVCSNN